MNSLRACLVALTTALEHRSADETVFFDPEARVVTVRSALDDAEARAPSSPSFLPVLAPDGLWEWSVRRDFVRALPAGAIKRRLGTTLAGPDTRRRFVRALAASATDDALIRAFARYRKRRARGWAARVMRATLPLVSRAR